MKTPDHKATYVHVCNGFRYRVLDFTDDTVDLVRVDINERGVRYVIAREPFDTHFITVDDLTAVADAAGVLVDAVRRPGEQPAVEFSTGPSGHGPLWSDANLARVFGLDQSAGGAS